MKAELFSPLQSGSRLNARWINKYALCLTDLMSFLTAFGLGALAMASATSGGLPSAWIGINSSNFFSPLLTHAAFVFSAILWFWGSARHYAYRKPFWSELHEVLSTLVLVAFLELAFIALIGWQFSRIWWFTTWVSAMVCVPIGRWAIKTILTGAGYWKKPTLIVGTGENAKEACLALRSQPLMGLDVIAYVSPAESLGSQTLTSVPILNGFNASSFNLLADVKVVIALEHHEHHLRDRWIRDLTRHGIRDISVIPAMRGVPLYGAEMSHFFSHEVLMLRLNTNLKRTASRVIKRSFDIVFSSLLLLILSPVLAYFAYKVREDGGNAFYGHTRIGQNGKKFNCLKLRSMVLNSEEVLRNLLANDPAAREEWNLDFKLKNDPRITKIGGFLRRTSLDELPQLWNVLKGEMSLVGPRPIVEAELARYADDADYYMMVKPGMTGLWQISGRNNIDYATRVYLDAWYVKNWSLFYDVAILFKTAGVVLQRDGAY
jgi:Undecaprenyl-phosphate galactose phosphotransferase WbaP